MKRIISIIICSFILLCGCNTVNTENSQISSEADGLKQTSEASENGANDSSQSLTTEAESEIESEIEIENESSINDNSPESDTDSDTPTYNGTGTSGCLATFDFTTWQELIEDDSYSIQKDVIQGVKYDFDGQKIIDFLKADYVHVTAWSMIFRTRSEEYKLEDEKNPHQYPYNLNAFHALTYIQPLTETYDLWYWIKHAAATDEPEILEIEKIDDISWAAGRRTVHKYTKEGVDIYVLHGTSEYFELYFEIDTFVFRIYNQFTNRRHLRKTQEEQDKFLEENKEYAYFHELFSPETESSELIRTLKEIILE